MRTTTKMANRLEIRISTLEKNLLKVIAKQRAMTVSEYILDRIFIQNPELTKEDYIYECKSDNRYNYILFGTLQQVLELQKKTLLKLYDKNANILISESFTAAKTLTEKTYGYKKIEVDKEKYE